MDVESMFDNITWPFLHKPDILEASEPMSPKDKNEASIHTKSAGSEICFHLIFSV